MKNQYNKYFCQHCGSNKKWVETIFNEEAIVSENGEVEYIGLSDEFEHTDKAYCSNCFKNWTGKLEDTDDMKNFEKEFNK